MRLADSAVQSHFSESYPPTSRPPDHTNAALDAALDGSERPAGAAARASVGDQHRRHTVLVVAGDADVRRYVRECLRDRADLRVLEAAATQMATRLAALQPPKLLIVDAPDAGVLDTLADVRAVLIADDVPREAMPNARVTALARPFGARDLQAIIDRLAL